MIEKINELNSLRDNYFLDWDYSGKLRSEAQLECDKIINKVNTIEEAWKIVKKSEYRNDIEENVTFFLKDGKGNRIKFEE